MQSPVGFSCRKRERKVCYDLVGGPVLQGNGWTDADQKKLDMLRDMFDNYLDEYLKNRGR